MRATCCYVSSIIAVVVLLMLTGCSGNAGALAPSNDIERVTHGSHAMWGLWKFTADPVAETLDIVPMRVSEMHLNALPFLEPPPFLHLTVESLEFNGDIVEADIGLRHPFLGLTEFTGFDVCGVLITNGTVCGFNYPEQIMAGPPDDTYLMNPDGLTRWWNPKEFPQDGTILAYKDGLLGTSDSVADFTSTLNAYKFFCDDLTDPDSGLDVLDPVNRCVFSSGQKNVRHYTIKLGLEGLVFNYAVDACWQFPQGDAPYEVPDDFGEGASRVEAWNVSITELENTLYNDGDASGGELSLLIDVWDHYNAGLNTVRLESVTGDFWTAQSAVNVGGGYGYSTYQWDIDDVSPSPDSTAILVEVVSEQAGYQGLLTGNNFVTAYFTYYADVADEPYEENCDFGDDAFEITDTYFGSAYPNYIGAGGLKLSRQSEPQCLLFNGYHDSTYHSVYAIETSDPHAGPIASFDTGNSFGMGIGAFVVDGYSEPGIDRLIFMSGSGITNQLVSLDWDGTDFSNFQTLPKPDTYGTWGCCVAPNGDLYLFNAYAYAPKFYFYDKSDGYSKSDLFTLETTTFDFENTGNFKGIVYNPVLDALVLFCRNQNISNGGQLCVLDLEGNLIFEDTDIFGTPTLIMNLGGTFIDMDDPECRLLIYAATEDGTIYFARYSAELDEKKVVSIPGPGVGHGICRGDVDSDGTMWAVWDYHNVWYHYTFRLAPPIDW